MRSATHNVAYASGLTYNPLGQLTQMRLGNNLLITNTYDLLSSRLKRIQAGSLLDLSYRYDAVGNVKAITDTTNSGQVQTFGYDALDRLLSAGTTSVGNGRYSESYGYNAIGNITVRISGTLTMTYGYSDTLHKHAVTWLSNGVTFQYDANGNMTRRVELSGTQRMTYTQGWDAENRLSVVTNTVTGLVTRFYYDGDGQRVKKTEGATPTVYVGAMYEKNVAGIFQARFTWCTTISLSWIVPTPLERQPSSVLRKLLSLSGFMNVWLGRHGSITYLHIQ